MKNHIVFVFVGVRSLWMGRHAVLKMQCKWACRLSDHSEISSWDLDWLLPSSRSSWIQFSLILKSFIVPTKATVTSELPHHILRCKGHNGPDSFLMHLLSHSSRLSLFLHCRSGFTCHWPFFLSFFFFPASSSTRSSKPRYFETHLCIQMRGHLRTGVTQ